MPEQSSRRTVILLFSLSIVAILNVSLVGCNLPTSADPTTLVQTLPSTREPLSTITHTPASLEPSPSSPTPLVILVSSSASDPEQVVEVQSLLEELAGGDGLDFELRSPLDLSEPDPQLRLVVVLPPDPGVTELASDNPEVQFLAVGIPDLKPTPNLSLIATGGGRPDQVGFIAGYIAAVITQDWRAGVINLANSTSGLAARHGFLNGAIFFCGLCRPVYPPFLQYPMYVEFPGGAGQAEQEAAADVLISSAVKTVYIPPGTADESLLVYLAQAGINLIGGISPPVDIQDRWAVTIRADFSEAIRKAWPDLIAGQGGLNLDASITLSNSNETLFSPGRQSLVDKMIAELYAGFIDTGIDPLTGELR